MPDGRVSAEVKAIVIKRAKGCCEYCWSQEKYSPDPFSAEHIVPLSKGGLTTADNLALACQGCNNHKYTATEAIDPATGQRVSLFHPRQDKWPEHLPGMTEQAFLLGLHL
jgi:5-methylcytosine-specific restriction endonuclease McrA